MPLIKIGDETQLEKDLLLAAYKLRDNLWLLDASRTKSTILTLCLGVFYKHMQDVYLHDIPADVQKIFSDTTRFKIL
jgi:hypothetical protein